MKRVAIGLFALVPATMASIAGCGFMKSNTVVNGDSTAAHYQSALLQVDYPDVHTCDTDCVMTPPPRVSLDESTEYWDISLEESMKLALANSKVMKDIGGLLRTPSAIRTVHDPAISYTDPRFGIEAALAAFDASLAANIFAENNDRALNNTFFGGGTRLLQQDLVTSQAQIFKRSPFGTQYTVRSSTEYDANNAPGNAFPSAYTQIVKAQVRQPLLQGAGLQFNQVAGVANAFGQTTAIPGVYNGVLVARISNDISLADFELSVRNFVNDVENAYLDLYFAYRDLQSRIDARDAALDTWRKVRALAEAGRIGGEAEKEAQAREQYFRFEEAVQNAVTGRPTEGTRSGGGNTPGSFRGTGGVLVAERRLRVLMGVPVTDTRVIRPLDEPHLARIEFQWETCLEEALLRRVEVRRQRWEIKSRELELTASRNFLLPQLDVVGRYRFRGFGDDLASPGSDNEPRFENAFDDLASGDFQETQVGMEFSMPFGFRRGHAAVRNAELRLAREVTLLQEQERTITYDLSNAIAELDRAFDVALTAYNRREAARTQYDATKAAFDVDKASLDLLLDVQRRLADADTNYYRALVEYALAVKNVHFEKGSLLDYNNILLEEGPWPMKAYEDAEERRRRRIGPLNDLPGVQGPPVVSRGPVPQLTLPPAGAAPGTATLDNLGPGLIPAPAPAELPTTDEPQETMPMEPYPQEPPPQAISLPDSPFSPSSEPDSGPAADGAGVSDEEFPFDLPAPGE